LILDLHVHTTNYSRCSRMTGEEMATRAIEIGLDGVVITEHNAFWTDEEITDLRRKYPALTILRGIEVTAAEGADVLIYGLTRMHELEKDMPAERILEIAHRRGAFTVWAHPLRKTLTPDPSLLTLPFDGLECQSMNIDPLEQDLHLKTAQQMRAAPFFNSDSHATMTLGVCVAEFDAPIKDEQELAESLRAGRSRPFIQSHHFEPAWQQKTETMSERIRKAIASGITDPADLRRRVGILAMSRIEQLLMAHGLAANGLV
jgi:predicted metal-dependent phosphoesterase TrpH